MGVNQTKGLLVVLVIFFVGAHVADIVIGDNRPGGQDKDTMELISSFILGLVGIPIGFALRFVSIKKRMSTMSSLMLMILPMLVWIYLFDGWSFIGLLIGSQLCLAYNLTPPLSKWLYG